MDRRRFLVLATGSAGALSAGLLAGCGDRSADAQGQVTVQLGDTVDDKNPQVVAERFFAERVAALTEERYVVSVMSGGVLGDHNTMNEHVRTGRMAFTKTLLANLTAYDKRLGVLSLPYAFDRQEDLFEALDGDLGRRCASILDEHGLTVLAYFDSGARNIYNTKRPIRTPSDLRGLRIRVPQNIVSIDMMNTLGADAVPMATNEALSGLRQGLVDGAENSPIFYVTSQHVDHARYYSWTRHQAGVDALLASKKWLAAQPAAVRDAVLRAGSETQAMEINLWRTETKWYVAEGAKRGSAVNDDVDPAAFRKAVAPVYDKHRGTFGDLTALLPNA
jgi:TRAP-type C4-dicarboxylate transport system substrate-binding protein